MQNKGSDRIRWFADDFDYRYKRPDPHPGERTVTEIIATVQEAVGVGQPHMAVDELPMPIRQLFQDTDFHFVGNRIFKKRDPIVDALDGNAGTDLEDADDDTKMAELYELTQRPDVMQWLEASGIHDEGELFELLSPREIPPKEEDALAHAEFGLLDAASQNQLGEEETEDPEHEPNPSIYKLLNTESLNSPFCSLGYRPPRDSYGFRSVERRSLWGEAAERRRRLFGDMKAEAEDLDDPDAIRIFYEKIRDDYYADKKIRQLWNKDSFLMDRAIYSDSLRRQNLDEETIRRKLWAGFDRVACVLPAVIQDGQVIRERRVLKPSIWNQGRSQALAELTLTSAQWSEIYKIVRRKSEWCRTQGSFQTLVVMKSLIKTQKTAESLRNQRRYLIQKTHQLNPSHRSELWRFYNTKLKSLRTLQSQM